MVLEVSELSKEFVNKDKKVTAVDRAYFQIKSGEFASIIGHSGSGKSTLFHLITGMLKPTSGKIMLDGLYINEAGERKLSRIRNEKIGYLLQEQNLLKNFTVFENVCMPNLISLNEKHKDTSKKADEILKIIGIEHIRNSFPNEISGGEARRVTIARALINDPELIIADEPTSNLDPDNSAVIMKLLKEISKNGVAVLISTHDMNFLEHSDKIFMMNKGKLEKV